MSEKRFLLTWDAAGGEPTGYKAQYKKIADSSWAEYPEVFATTSGFVTGLDVCSFYDFRVSGINAKGAGPASEPATGIMGRVPGAPVGLVWISEYDNSSESISINLSWITDNGGCAIQQTFIEHKEDEAASFIANILSNNSNAYTITGLAGDTSYNIRLRASNIVGTGNYSNELFVTTPDEPTIPAQTTNLDVEYIEDSPAVLTINATTNDYIYVGTDTGFYKIEGWGEDAVVKSVSILSYPTSNITTDTQIKIYACDSEGNIGGNILSLETNGIRFKSIDVSKLKMLNALTLTDINFYNPLQSINIDLSHLLELTSLIIDLSFYEISSLRAAGVSLEANNSISANTIDVSAINRFYQDLNTTTGASLFLSITNDNSTPSNTRNNSIAEDKGYSVI